MAAFSAGRPDHGYGWGRRLLLAWRIFVVHFKLRRESATTFGEQLVLLDAILRLDQKRPGDIAEFGSYNGACSVVLSIGAKITGRRLRVFDSFEGLPPSTDTVSNVATGKVLEYKEGMYAGSLDHVRANIQAFGCVDSVDFVKGFFSETLKARPVDERFALVFEDADLISSVKEVLRYAWPRLNPGSPFFSHEARDLEVCEIFFDRDYWQANLGCHPPGLIGVGMGIPVNFKGFDDRGVGPLPGYYGSCLAYVHKR